jgi:acetoacetate decarboxylase
MYLDCHAPIAGGRELWGFPKKLARPKIRHEGDAIVSTLHYGQSLCALATMGYKHRAADKQEVLHGLSKPNYVMKIIPHVDGTPRICELVRYQLEDVHVKECWSAPAELQLFRHVAADVARLPVVLTPLVQKQIDDSAVRDGIAGEDAKMKLLAAKQPSLEFMTPEQISAAAVFLCSPAADQIRGTTLSVDGGWTAQ